MPSEALYMDCKEVSLHFGIEERIIRAMAVARLLPSKQFGKVWRFPRERIAKIAQRIPKTPLEDYEVENTLIVWLKLNNKAPVGFANTFEEKLRSIFDDEGIYDYYASHKITPHEPERSYRKLDGRRIVDNSARSGGGKRFDVQ